MPRFFSKQVAGFSLLLAGLFWVFFSINPFTASKPETFSILMRIDFGPAGKPVHEAPLEVEKGTTPKEAVSQVFPIRTGKSCCSLKEISEIDGVAVDASLKKWWICLVNGSKSVSPQKYRLKSGDKLEWKYIQG